MTRDRTVATAGDLVDWWADPARRGWVDPMFAGGAPNGVRVYFQPPRADSGRRRRPPTPPTARLVGPHVPTIPCTAEQLRAEARYLAAAADVLAVVEAGFDPTTGTFGLPDPAPGTLALPFGTTVGRPTVEVGAP